MRTWPTVSFLCTVSKSPALSKAFKYLSHLFCGKPENSASWLFRVLRNLIIDHLRRQKHLSDEDVPETADAATPESVLLQREDAAALYRAMERLGAGDREVLTLYCFAHLSGAELAAALGVTPAVIRQRLRRARTRLRQKMEEDGYEF